MVLKCRRGLVIGLLIGGLVISLPLAAQQNHSSGGRAYSRNNVPGQGGVDLDSTVERLRRETGGRVLHAETRNNRGRKEHRIRIITDHGMVKRYRVDAGSGKELPYGNDRR